MGFDLNQGALAPVSDEVDLSVDRITGALPPELRGTYVRNGPNPLSGRFVGSDVTSWWPEAAMLHAICIDEERVTYRNRWVRTRRWAEHTGAVAIDCVDTNPNVNVISHAGEILALAEGGAPLAISRALETLGEPRRHPGITGGVTAHPKVDPSTGELIAFRSAWQPPYLRYGVIDAGGGGGLHLDIDLPSPVMMHDCAITATRTILLDLCVGLDLSLLGRGVRLPLGWLDDRPARLGVLPRAGGPVRWFEIEPCFIQHVGNAFDIGDHAVCVEAVRYPWYFRFDPAGAPLANPLGTLWRYTLDLADGRVREEPLADLCVELPRIDERRTGRKHSFTYAVEQPTDHEMRGIVRFDRDRGTAQRHPIPAGDQNSEAVFVPRPGGAGEDEGWLLVCVWRHTTDTTDVLVLDAADLGAEPIASIHLPRRIPAGFHGAWLDAERDP